MTAQEAMGLLFDCDSEIEEDVSEAEDSIKVDSESDSSYEPNGEIANHISPSKTFMPKNCEMQFSSPSKQHGKLC